jgi:hypothetical protein
VHSANPSIVSARVDRDEALLLERSQHATRVTRIEAQSGSKRSHLDALWPDLPQRPRLTHRPGAAEEAFVQGTDPLGYRSVEAPNPLN